jgi:hypothetical protein
VLIFSLFLNIGDNHSRKGVGIHQFLTEKRVKMDLASQGHLDQKDIFRLIFQEIQRYKTLKKGQFFGEYIPISAPRRRINFSS